MIVGIHQPNYLPWLGYFRKIARSELFVFFDNVQMPIGKSLVFRNRIKTAQGVRWISVPTRRDSAGAPIAATAIAPGNWRRKHIGTMEAAYGKAGFGESVLDLLRPIIERDRERIAELNIALIQAICIYIGLDEVKFLRASELDLKAEGAASITEILERAGTGVYLTGDGAGSMRHLNIDELNARGIEVAFVNSDFATYPQMHGDFEPKLSIVDALFNCGPERTRAMIFDNAV